MRQLIIARKDLGMSAGKLSAQVSHASMAFLTNMIKKEAIRVWKIRWYAATEEPWNDRPMLYGHPDLQKFADEAYKEGKHSFSCQKVGDRFELCENEVVGYQSTLYFPRDVYEDWINGIFTKTICEAKNRNQLLKAVTIAESLGLKEDEDFFLIKDNCLTELEPEEVDGNGVGRTLTCIGFAPLPDEIAHQISKKYQLYR